MKKDDIRFSLCIDDGEPIIYIGGNPIMEGIFKKKSEWTIGFKLKIGTPLTVISLFKDWKKGKSFEIQNENNTWVLTEKDISDIKLLIQERDKRIKI